MHMLPRNCVCLHLTYRNQNEGFPNGIFHPCALWARALARWDGCRHTVVVSVGIILNITLTVLVFGAESVSYERSWRETAAKLNHCSALVFFEII